MISVLIVDDHALFRAGLRSRLELEQDITSVGEAATAEEAVSKARSLQPDLVLLDLLLPGTSGHEAIPELAKVSPGSRVLVVSSQAAPSSVRQALSAGAADLLAADGVLLGTPANIGYMSGALKHFFDTVYYPCLDATVGLPYGVYVHGNDDTAGALRSIATVTGALRWKQVAEPLSLTGSPRPADLEAARELAATVAVQL